MTNEIKCPNCGHNFTLNDVMSDELNLQLKAAKEKLNSDAQLWKKQKEEEWQNELKKTAIAAQQKATEELSMKLKSLEDEAKLKNQLLQDLQRKELDFIRQQNEIEQRNKNFEIEKEKYFLTCF